MSVGNVEDPETGQVLHGSKKGQVVTGAGFPDRSGGAPATPVSTLPVGDAISSSRALSEMNSRNTFGNRGLGVRGRKVDGTRTTSRTDPGRRALGGNRSVFGGLLTPENIGGGLLGAASLFTPPGQIKNLLSAISGANTARKAVRLLGN